MTGIAKAKYLGRIGSTLRPSDSPSDRIVRLELDNARLRSQAEAQSREIERLVYQYDKLKQARRWSASPVSYEAIVEAVSAFFESSPKMILEHYRAEPHTLHRHITWAIMKEMTGLHPREIALAVQRDHASICHGIKRVKAKRETDPQFDADVVAIIAELDTRATRCEAAE